MSARVPLFTLVLFLGLLGRAAGAEPSWWRQFFPKPQCPESIIETLYASGMNEFYSSRARFRRRIQALENQYGAEPFLLKVWFERIIQNPEIVALMRGLDVPREGKKNWRLSGGWGQDHLLVQAPHLWAKIRQNLPEIGQRYHERLKLDWDLIYELLSSDEISMGDSAWLLFHPTEVEPLKKTLERAASLKVTYFDFHSTPDGLFPRYVLEDLHHSWRRLVRSPRELTAGEAFACEEGSLNLRSSLGEWGLLPLERERAEGQLLWLAPEHRIERPDLVRRYRAFSHEFRFYHSILMHQLLDETKTSAQRARTLSELMHFRGDFLPLQSLRVAEIGRFNIPPEAHVGGRAQLYFGFLVLMQVRPIEVVYVEAPKGPLETLLKADYENLSFRVIGETERGYKMRTTATDLEKVLLAYLTSENGKRHLTDEQNQILDSLFLNRAVWRPNAKAVW